MRRLPSGHFAGAAAVDQVRLSQALDAVGDLAPDRVALMVAFLRQRGGGPPGALGRTGAMPGLIVAREHLDRFGLRWNPHAGASAFAGRAARADGRRHRRLSAPARTATS